MNSKARLLTAAAIAAALAAGSATAHPHKAGPSGQIIANGQNHPVFIAGVSCEDYASAGPAPIGPAWYGLETAHHGPDAGDPGRGDDCYATTGGVAPGDDVENPAIR